MAYEKVFTGKVLIREYAIPASDNPQQVELVLIHDWSISRIPLAEIDYGRNLITAVDSIGARCLNFFNLDNWEKNPLKTVPGF